MIYSVTHAKSERLELFHSLEQMNDIIYHNHGGGKINQSR